MSDLSDPEVRQLLQNLKQDLNAFAIGTNYLEYELESVAKHIPAYIKIVKGHIQQLKTVLSLENHNNRTLDNAGLATTVQQLIKLFNTLHEDDIQLLEDLAIAAQNWQPEILSTAAQESSKTPTLLESVETTSY